MLYKVVNNLVDLKEEDYLTRVTRRTRKNPTVKFHTFSSRKDCLKHSFFPRTVIQWNNLPAETTSLDSLDSFKEAIVKLDLTLQGPYYCY